LYILSQVSFDLNLFCDHLSPSIKILFGIFEELSLFDSMFRVIYFIL
jgi:hypothetical protein